MKSAFFVLALFMIFSFSCKDGNACLGTLACTEELRYITALVKDEANHPVLLDSVYSLHESSAAIYYSEDELGPRENGNYIIWSDLEMDLLDKKGTEITFEGWANDEKILSEKFTIGHDCCHIELLNGNPEIIIR